MNKKAEFVPEWASPPGETIRDVLKDRGWSADQLADRLGESVEMVENLLSGRQAVTIGLARSLHNAIGASVAFWMARQLQYEQDAAQLEHMRIQWRNALPVADMSRLGWISIQEGSELEIDTLLRFFEVHSVSAWRARYTELLKSAEFRTSPTFDSEPASVAAWLRQGERIAATVSCAPWNESALRQLLVTLRSLTRVGDPQRFLPSMQTATAACGIAVAALPAPAGCTVSGATMWLSNQKALLLLSARHLTDDHLWFTFYHECAHLILHRETRLFIEAENTSRDAKEEAANEFAAQELLTHDVRESLTKVPLSTDGILRLASRGGVAPGIIVGQLQKMGRLKQERLNGLKRRYKWVGDRLVRREKA